MYSIGRPSNGTNIATKRRISKGPASQFKTNQESSHAILLTSEKLDIALGNDVTPWKLPQLSPQWLIPRKGTGEYYIQ